MAPGGQTRVRWRIRRPWSSVILFCVLVRRDRGACTPRISPSCITPSFQRLARMPLVISVVDIRIYIDGGYDGVMWQTVWRKHRQSLLRGRGNLHLSQTKAFALIDFALIGGWSSNTASPSAPRVGFASRTRRRACGDRAVTRQGSLFAARRSLEPTAGASPTPNRTSRVEPIAQFTDDRRRARRGSFSEAA